jgi:hypothetical protein
MKTKIIFTTVEEGFEILREHYSGSEVVGGETIDFLLSNDKFDSSIPVSVLHGAIQKFREWDANEDDEELFSDGVNYTFPDGSIVPKGMRVGYINEDNEVCIDENITVNGTVEEFRVFATMTTTLCVNVYAVSQNNAMSIAKEIDGGEFVEVEELGEWNIYNATPVEG